MLLDVFLFLATIGFIFLILGFIRKDIVIFSWIGAVILISIPLMAGKLEIEFCEYDGSAWQCTTSNYESYPLIYLFGGLGIFALIYAILNSFVWTAETIREAT